MKRRNFIIGMLGLFVATPVIAKTIKLDSAEVYAFGKRTIEVEGDLSGRAILARHQWIEDQMNLSSTRRVRTASKTVER